MKKRLGLGIAAACLLPLGVWAFLVWHRPRLDLHTATLLDRPPAIRPDYRDTVIPPNIAPLNFVVQEPGTECVVRIHAARGDAIELRTRNSQVVIPTGPWRRLLAANRGQTFSIDIWVRSDGGAWQRFPPVVNTIADAEIDNYLLYRLLKPVHTVYGEIGIYQRDLRSYCETPVVENKSFAGACVNCHTLAPRFPDRMILQTRGTKNGVNYSGTIVVRDGRIEKVDTRSLAKAGGADRGRLGAAMAAYAAWHPRGEVVVYSANDIFQFFHAVGQVRDVFDAESDLAVYDVDAHRVSTSPEISRPDRLETFPTWSPDGRFLYFCAADPLPQKDFRQVRYDLMRIAYDSDRGEWGELEAVLRAKDTDLSITEPRVSPDGKWLLCCMSEYGSFPVYQASSDLYLLDLETRQYRRLPVNSPRSESWHCWSANSRWIAFASKRQDGVFGRIYFSFVDEAGRAHQPILLPQKDPTFYDRLIKTYSVPELAAVPAPVHSRTLGRAIRWRGDRPETGAAAPASRIGGHTRDF
ncbi:MAG: cytochrome C biosynthesis protein [Candidatus Anammoximicrobium sp.]|nr:cytochrome C biosynthesis protein [Candidatus Anammoximicrobium sp.]